MSKNVIYAVRRLNDDEGFEIQPHNISHARPTMGLLVIFDGVVPVRKRFTRRSRCACIQAPAGGGPISGFEMHDIVVENAGCGRVMIYGKQRSEIGSRAKITGQAWWLEIDGFIDTED